MTGGAAEPASPAREAPYIIREARLEDVPALVAIETAAFDPAAYGEGFTMNARSFRRHVKRDSILLVAEQNGGDHAIAGYALGWVKKTSPYVRFTSLAVLAEHGGRGAAWRLFEGIEKEAQRRGLRGVRLEIREDNVRLLARYKRQGYEVFKMVPHYYSDGAGAIRMIKDFSPGNS
ncbi:MAG: GNAT family N-acetyltransferase [Bauldia sp.]|nr:GNAT family N-acetyltransferase [Bauldia sp.]